MRRIPQRELRNNVPAVLRRVIAGERLRVTVAGRDAADLLPIDEGALHHLGRTVPPGTLVPATEQS